LAHGSERCPLTSPSALRIRARLQVYAHVMAGNQRDAADLSPADRGASS